MTTREQLEAEAEALYPDEFFDEEERAAHVRAKTVSPERLYKAAMTMHNLIVDTPWGESSSEVKADLEVICAAFRAAGFYVEGIDD